MYTVAVQDMGEFYTSPPESQWLTC